MFPVFASFAEATSAYWDPLGVGRTTIAYWRDACERSVLYLDVMRQRGNQYLEHMEQTKPNVLGFDAEVLVDGRTLPSPVNYELMRIVPPAGIEIDESMRPFVVVDPRAGHGPGIGGFKPDSEIGVALRAGHPCYFIGFLPFPVPGQTVEDVVEAEVEFLRHVIERHPETAEKPMVVGNCQAGWQLMMAAALEPECFGPILIAGAPLSYWAGERGKAPMRYSGGLLGGSWVTALAGDLGHGLFDGAWLVQNFEKLNPANTLWTKQYRLYANVDTEAKRYLQFERWWGGHVVLNAEEIQYIVDNLFVGNRLSTAQLVTRDGRRIDLRNVRSPIVVFCSKGDDITPPPQALGWIEDLYDSVDDIIANEQTIVYCVHDTTGHLGIFVSGNVSRKEHTEFTANMDYIDILPPGLYETKVTERSASTANPDLVDGDYLLEFSPRTLEDLDGIVQNRPDDERRFATVARVSDINLGLYRRYGQPWLQAVMTPEAARWIRRMHPIRLGYKLLSDRNPLAVPLPVMAEAIRANRHTVDASNPFRIAEGMVSDQIERSLEGYREVRDSLSEWAFLQFYGQPWLQILVGMGASEGRVLPNPGAQPEHRRFITQRQQEVHASIERGNSHHAVVRALIFVLGGAPTTDERNFQYLKAARAEIEPNIDLTSFKALVRDQFFILKHDSYAALEALPLLLAGESEDAIDAHVAHIEQVVSASGPLDQKSQSRLELVKSLFDRAKSEARANGKKGDNGESGGPQPKALKETAPQADAIENEEKEITPEVDAAGEMKQETAPRTGASGEEERETTPEAVVADEVKQETAEAETNDSSKVSTSDTGGRREDASATQGAKRQTRSQASPRRKKKTPPSGSSRS